MKDPDISHLSKDEQIINRAAWDCIKILRTTPSPYHALEALASMNAELVHNTLKPGSTHEQGLETLKARALELIAMNVPTGKIQ